mgnify:CR=1 FL=1
MILGVGIDLTPISRVAAILARHGRRFEERVFTNGEREYCTGRAQPAQHFAARFAAKEAAIKALGAPKGLSWVELETVTGPNGAPGLRLHGHAAAAAGRLGIKAAHVTLTHAADLVAAVVILEG